jgi:hypothetical protein
MKRNHPKGYVGMLEQQQSQLVVGLKEMYRRLQKASAWEGPSLVEVDGQPLTHDILSALGLLRSRHDGWGRSDIPGEDCAKPQSRVVLESATLFHEKDSPSPRSACNHHEHFESALSRNEMPVQPESSLCKNILHSFGGPRSPPAQNSVLQIEPLAQQYYTAHPSIWSSSSQNLTGAGYPRSYESRPAQALAYTDCCDNLLSTKSLMQAREFDTLASWLVTEAQMDISPNSANQGLVESGTVFDTTKAVTDFNQLDAIRLSSSDYLQQDDSVS